MAREQTKPTPVHLISKAQARIRHQNRPDREGIGHHGAFQNRSEYRLYLEDSGKPRDVRDRALRSCTPCFARHAGAAQTSGSESGDGCGLDSLTSTPGNGREGEARIAGGLPLQHDRRSFLKHLGTVTGGFVLLPYVTHCGGESAPQASTTPQADSAATAGGETAEPQSAPPKSAPSVPKAQPDTWNALAFNRDRGNAGAIPESYLADINGPDGDKKHLGKHLPYIPDLKAKLLPAGYVALMWGDPDKGFAKHPNAARTEEKPAGHWYNWIRIRKAVEGEADELQSNYSDWPTVGEDDNGAYVAFGGDNVEADDGKNTVYLAALPKDVKAGDKVRIWAHCITHGEYVDFIEVKLPS